MPACETGNDYDGRLAIRISSIFVILLGSWLGAWFPVFAARQKGVEVPDRVFFVAKYFGSGVIITTAFIHLLAPAAEALSNQCLTGPIRTYPWVEAICIMSVLALFLVELIALRYTSLSRHDEGHEITPKYSPVEAPRSQDSETAVTTHIGQGDRDIGSHDIADSRTAQMTGIFVLEFGIIFHSIFIGLTLAVSGTEFATLYAVLVFHQTFEGIALGSRFASVSWPEDSNRTPYMLSIGYALSTPIAIAIGLGVRSSHHPGSRTALITNGVFDAISAGILIFTGLVELMARDFIFSSHMLRASIHEVLSAYGAMCCSAALMALHGKWA